VSVVGLSAHFPSLYTDDSVVDLVQGKFLIKQFPVLLLQGFRFSKLLKKSQENLRKMTELTKIVGKSYDNAGFQNFLRTS